MLRLSGLGNDILCLRAFRLNTKIYQNISKRKYSLQASISARASFDERFDWFTDWLVPRAPTRPIREEVLPTQPINCRTEIVTCLAGLFTYYASLLLIIVVGTVICLA